ncbi:MAG TPA: ABC transporter ATP-binding protein [Candidatus Thermoplasmatota archaeon]|nr:ABC transporter ATP-binding protein [Candidatus Thermoplasmatota archaeon]
MPPLVELENVSKFYGAQPALGPLTLALPEASIGLLGPNGAGKTTLLRLLLGLMRPTSGTVRVLGEEVGPRSNHLRRRVGYVPEGEAVFPDLNGVEAVAFAGRLVGMPRGEALQRAHQVLDYVELGEARYRAAETYSTGMRQRLKLAQALVHGPELLVLDEPTEGVDPDARIHLLDLISELQREHGIRLIVSTHILNDVERLATHALVLNEGRAAALGTLDELRRSQSRSYIVRVNGPATLLADELTRQGVRCELTPPNVRVELDDPRDVLRKVAATGMTVRHLAPTTLSLEEAFEAALAAAPTAAEGGGATAGAGSPGGVA